MPKILEWFYKDFATSQKEMLIILRDRFMSLAQQSSLLFLDNNSSDSFALKFQPYDWGFTYTIDSSLNSSSKLQTAQKTSAKGENNLQTNSLVEFSCLFSPVKDGKNRGNANLLPRAFLSIAPSSLYRLIISSQIQESEFYFSIPFQFLDNLFKIRKNQINVKWDKEIKFHLELIKQSSFTLRNYMNELNKYHGLTFRPSSYKNDRFLQFLPIELFVIKTFYSIQTTTTVIPYFQSFFASPAAYVYSYLYLSLSPNLLHLLIFISSVKEGLRQLRELRFMKTESDEKLFFFLLRNT